MGRSLDPIVQRFLSNFHACRLQKSQKQPKNRVFGLVEPVFSIFRPIFGVIFIFRAIARIFLLLFLCHRCRRYFTVIFQYFPDVERQRSPDAAPCAAYGATPCSLHSLFGVQLTEKFIKPFFCERFTLEPLWTEFVSFMDIVLRLGGVYRFCQFGQSGVGK